jgi:NAD(P)-dependent dehydrogenase (short-subunit alcohol dehydrogenase family)
MKLDLAEKVALVTGSSKGIGWAIAQTLHAEGCRVTLNGRNEWI